MYYIQLVLTEYFFPPGYPNLCIYIPVMLNSIPVWFLKNTIIKNDVLILGSKK